MFGAFATSEADCFRDNILLVYIQWSLQKQDSLYGTHSAFNLFYNVRVYLYVFIYVAE